mmetsp:Transcript_39672/g.48136  ORF Transcript_39672/g.48136 Transcript_39672/m.48136 type:complete len:354 (-) Transcript_39672:78-1139(-)|eukprot:CAMPEP_0197858580 /NCGR_PEP_ID=MMETSP1438-20131217/32472_1 /TAXON_ID=1461541 /ORGANISM="Pterosperma sp., Strain CCMP1384" /LENGTH=353 /DNA_ID=CAMNT_0043474787 /DNA_START=164 /DNA_END=1225 /DNA_ORIENTATION=+
MRTAAVERDKTISSERSASGEAASTSSSPGPIEPDIPFPLHFSRSHLELELSQAQQLERAQRREQLDAMLEAQMEEQRELQRAEMSRELDKMLDEQLDAQLDEQLDAQLDEALEAQWEAEYGDYYDGEEEEDDDDDYETDPEEEDAEFEAKMARNPELFATGPVSVRKLFSYDWAQGFLSPYVVSTDATVEKVLETLPLESSDFVTDLGCGDGRFVIQAASKHGCPGLGVDLDGELIEKAHMGAEECQVSHLVKFEQCDLMTKDLSSSTVVVVYHLPSALDIMGDLLHDYLVNNPAGVVVSIMWEIPACKEFEKVQFAGREDLDQKAFYIYTKERIFTDKASEGSIDQLDCKR